MDIGELTPLQVRVLGCLIEKKETTPEQYPLTLNALRNACNQKSARFPVCNYTEGEVGHTIRELESMGLAREVWGARAPKYEHVAGKAFGLHSKGLALMCPMMLRGPQTLGELRTHSHRLYEFVDLEEVQLVLQRLFSHEPPMAVSIPKQPGQKEERYAHLLSGEPQIPSPVSSVVTAVSSIGNNDLVERVAALENELQSLADRLAQLESVSENELNS